MHKEIDIDIVAKGEELYPIDIHGVSADVYEGREEEMDYNFQERQAYQQGAMDERQRINEEISKIESWITENRPHLTGLGALTAMLKQVKAVETLPLQITKSN
jgi:hypothetical protein